MTGSGLRFFPFRYITSWNWGFFLVEFLNDEGRIKRNAEKRKSRGKKTAREMWRDQKRSWEQDEEIETRIWVKVQF